MVQIKMGAGITEMSGSLSGNTYSRNRSGAYMKTRTIPTNVRSTSQNKSRSNFTILTNWYHHNLTDEQRTSWSSYANAISMKNKLGESRHLTGQLMFVRSNQARLTAGLTLVTSAPQIQILAEKDPSLLLSAGSILQTICLSFDNSLPWSTEPGAYMLISIGRPQGHTRNYYSGPWKYLGKIPGNSPTPPASPYIFTSLPYVISAGQKIFAQIRISRADGRLSQPFTCSSIVSELPPDESLLLDTFNDYTNGQLSGQGGWSGNVNFLVEDALAYEGAKAISNIASVSTPVSKISTSKEVCHLSGMLRRDVSRGSIVTTQKLYIDDTTLNEVAHVRMEYQDIAYFDNAVRYPLLLNFQLATWYKIDIVMVTTPTPQNKYRVNDGPWTSWHGRSNIASLTAPQKVLLGATSLSDGAIAYYDYMH